VTACLGFLTVCVGDLTGQVGLSIVFKFGFSDSFYGSFDRLFCEIQDIGWFSSHGSFMDTGHKLRTIKKFSTMCVLVSRSQ